jgi:hypothetical protein
LLVLARHCSLPEPGYPHFLIDTTAPTPSPTGFLQRTNVFFAAARITVEAVMTDNGCLLPVTRVRRSAGHHHTQTDPALPAPNQRQGRTVGFSREIVSQLIASLGIGWTGCGDFLIAKFGTTSPVWGRVVPVEVSGCEVQIREKSR